MPVQNQKGEDLPIKKKKRKEKKRKEPEELVAINYAINAFFEGKQKNSRREEWISQKNGASVPEILKDIYDSLRVFFRKKKWYNGGPIPDELLFTKRNFHLVNNIALVDAIDLAYLCIDEQKSLAKTTYKENIDIVLAVRIIHSCETKDIPQDHIAGILLLYLELCEKVELL